MHSRFGVPFALITLAATAAAQPPTRERAARAGAGDAAVVTRDQFRAFGWIAGRWHGVGHGALSRVQSFHEEYLVLDDSTMRMRTYTDSTFSTVTDSTELALRNGVMRSVPARGTPQVVQRFAGDSVQWTGGSGTLYLRLSDDRWQAIFPPRTEGEARYYELRRIGRRAP